MSEQAYKTPDWEIRREIRPEMFRTYAHGYWRDPFVVCVLGRVLIGKRALRKRWDEAELEQARRELGFKKKALRNCREAHLAAEADRDALAQALREIDEIVADKYAPPGDRFSEIKDVLARALAAPAAPNKTAEYSQAYSPADVSAVLAQAEERGTISEDQSAEIAGLFIARAMLRGATPEEPTP